MHEPTGAATLLVTNHLAAGVTLHTRGPLTGVWFEPLRYLRFLVSGRYDCARPRAEYLEVVITKKS
jgi:hypothetical protein